MTALYSPEAEREIMAALAFHGRQALATLPVALRDPLVYSPAHRSALRVILRLAERDAGTHPAKVREAALELGEAGIADDPERIGDFLDALGALDSLSHFAEIITDLSARRDIRQAAELVMQHADDRTIPIAALVRERIGPLVTRAAPPLTTGDGMVDALEMIEADARLGGALPGISVGIPSLDNLTDGLCPERLIVLAARPGCGKTAFALHCAQQAAQNDEETYFITLEQPPKQLQRRRLAMVSGIDLRTEVRMGRWERHARTVLALAEELREQPLTFDDRSDTPTGISLAVQRHNATVKPVKLVVVDYLSWVRFEEKRDRHDLSVADVTKALARLAKDLHCAVLLLVQVNRGAVHDGKPRRPAVSDLRDAGQIEQDADQVILLWEPPPDEGVPYGDNQHAVMEFVVGKNRHGPVGSVRVEWSKPTYRYREAPRLSAVRAA